MRIIAIGNRNRKAKVTINAVGWLGSYHHMQTGRATLNGESLLWLMVTKQKTIETADSASAEAAGQASTNLAKNST